MIKRRKFLQYSTLLGVNTSVHAKIGHKESEALEHVLPTIIAIEAHMFPPESPVPLPDTKKMKTFLRETLSHPSFDKDIRRFIIEGAEDFMKKEKKSFILMESEAREDALRHYEKSSYGQAWLSRILLMALEGLFSDPIYLANQNEDGWKALNSFAGMPRPERKYMDV